MSKKATEQQLTVVAHDLAPGEVLKIDAGAGSGKTSTLRGYAARRPHLDTLYVGFNKSVVTEAERKFPSHVECRSSHSLAYRPIAIPIIDEGGRVGNLGYVPIKIALRTSFRMAALAKATMISFCNSADTQINESHVPEKAGKHKVSPNEVSRGVELAKQLWNIVKTGKDKFLPLTHDVYLKLFQLTNPILRHDLIMFDEAQDANPVTLDFIMKQRDHGKRIILVGDRFQQVYSWRGAVDALQKVDAPSLRLSKSFRFGQPVADVANFLLDTFFGAAGHVEGFDEVESTFDHEIERLPDQKMTRLCRTNKGVIHCVIDAVATSTPYSFNGDLKEVMDLIMDAYYLKYRLKDKMTPKSRLKGYDAWESLKEVADFDAELSPIVNIVEKFGQDLPRLHEVMWDLHRSDEQEADIHITTVHKAKGLEWSSVQLKDDFPELVDEKGNPLPLSHMVSEEDKKTGKKHVGSEEINILYVAVTRAMNRLGIGPSIYRLINKIAPPPPELEEVGEVVHSPGVGRTALRSYLQGSSAEMAAEALERIEDDQEGRYF